MMETKTKMKMKTKIKMKTKRKKKLKYREAIEEKTVRVGRGGGRQ